LETDETKDESDAMLTNEYISYNFRFPKGSCSVYQLNALFYRENYNQGITIIDSLKGLIWKFKIKDENDEKLNLKLQWIK
jgi:hypothetical protein